MWDAMMQFEIRRQELIRETAYAHLLRELDLGSRRSAFAKRRLSARLRAMADRLATSSDPTNPSVITIDWNPLLKDLCR